MTEDDIFRRLKRCTFNELLDYCKNHYHGTIEERVEKCGWTMEEADAETRRITE